MSSTPEQINATFQRSVHLDESGSLLIHKNLHRNCYNYLRDFKELEFGFLKIKGLIPFKQVIKNQLGVEHRLLSVTLDGNLIQINKENPEGAIIKTSPVREIIQISQIVFLIDLTGDIRELNDKSYDYRDYTLSEVLIKDVKSINWYYMNSYIIEPIIIQTNDNKLILSKDHRLRTSQTAKLEVKDVDKRIIITTDNKLYTVNPTSEGYNLVFLITLEYEVKHLNRFNSTINIIDYSNKLRSYKINEEISIHHEYDLCKTSINLLEGIKHEGEYKRFLNNNHVETIDGSVKYMSDKLIDIELPCKLYAQ